VRPAIFPCCAPPATTPSPVSPRRVKTSEASHPLPQGGEGSLSPILPEIVASIVLDFLALPVQYIVMLYTNSQVLDRELKKGSAELLILSLIETRPRHGYEISKQIELRSEGAVRFHVASLYPLLYRLERRGWMEGRWVEKAGQRRRRYYRLTPEGRKVLASQRKGWQVFAAAINRIAGFEHA